MKRTEGAFNQLPTGQALEHINKLCKIAGGLVSITHNRPALDRWMLTCSDLAQITAVVQAIGKPAVAQHWVTWQNAFANLSSVISAALAPGSMSYLTLTVNILSRQAHEFRDQVAKRRSADLSTIQVQNYHRHGITSSAWKTTKSI